MLNVAPPPRVFGHYDLSATRALIVGVSGGGDSLALLILLHNHLQSTGSAARLVAVTVDHALRPQSAREAEDVAAFCATLGIRHVTRVWTGPKPATGLAAAAREARYRLLCETARDENAAAILVAHTADDQAETVLMRSARSTAGAETARGLAAMAPATLLQNRFWLLRPLLDMRRDELRAILRARGIGWIDDPSNDDPRHERVRARRELRASGTVEELAARARCEALRREAAGREAAALIGRHATRPAAGLIRLDPAFAGEQAAAATYALRILIALAGGKPMLPEERATAAVFSALAGPPFRATLGRCVIDARRSGICLHRERRGLPVPTPATDDLVWDGRYRIEAETGGWLVSAGGEPQAAEAVPASILAAAARAEPSFCGDGAPPPRAVPVIAPWAARLPSFDLAPARAAARLIGGELPPSPPYRGHDRSKA